MLNLSTLNSFPYADLNGDAFVNQTDVDLMADLILGLPLLMRPVTLEPASGSSEVGVTVRPKVSFPRPVDVSTLNSNNFYASFAGRKLPARIVPRATVPFAGSSSIRPCPIRHKFKSPWTARRFAPCSALPSMRTATVQPAGVARANFSTVSITPIPNTALAGRIVDPGPDLKPRTVGRFYPRPRLAPPSTRPIEGVKVFLLGMEDMRSHRFRRQLPSGAWSP